MVRTISATDIKWAYSKELSTNPIEEFLASLCLFTGEILRSDEIGLLVWEHTPTLMVRINKVDFETESHYIEMIDFKDSEIKTLLETLNTKNDLPAIGFGRLEVFCYRPKSNKPYHPKMHPTYIRAREQASRILNTIFMVMIHPSPDEISSVCFAQVDAKISKKFFKKFSKQVSPQKQQDEAVNFTLAIDRWMSEFYTDKIGSKQYKTKNRYPLAPKPLEGTELFVITTDEDDNLISYRTPT